MTTSYPSGIDNFTNPTSTDTLSSATVPHASEHANANDAIKAIETELGTNPKGSYASVAARLAASTGSITTWRKAASGGETSLTGTDDFSTSLAYTVGQEQVFINGVLLERGVDYTASTGSSITGLTALVAGDIATVISVGTFNVANAIPLSTVTAKGDLLAATGASTVANLGVGADGSTLVANSSASTGVSWAGPSVAAGKNAIINGDFSIWQRGTSFTPSTHQYTADRWNIGRSTGGFSVTQQSSGLTGFLYAARVQRVSSNADTSIIYAIHDVESANSYRFAGQNVVLSFWARAGANFSASSNTFTAQIFTGTGVDGSLWGGYTGISNIATSSVTLTTSWQRFTVTATAASNIAQIGLQLSYTPTGTANTNDYFELAGVQLETGSVATAFSRAGGTLQGELSAAQRYYFREGYVGTGYEPFAAGLCFSSTQALIASRLPFQMRVTPAVAYSSTVGNFSVRTASNSIIPLTAIAQDSASPWNVFHKITVASGLVAGNATLMNVGASGPCYIEYNSEL